MTVIYSDFHNMKGPKASLQSWWIYEILGIHNSMFFFEIVIIRCSFTLHELKN